MNGNQLMLAIIFTVIWVCGAVVSIAESKPEIMIIPGLITAVLGGMYVITMED